MYLVIRLLLLGALIVSIQSALEVGGWLSLLGVSPMLSLLFVILAALRYGPLAGALLGFFVGMVQDVYSYEYLGASALAMCTCGYLAGLAEEGVLQLSTGVRILVLAVATILYQSIYWFAVRLAISDLYVANWQTLVLTSLYTVLVGVFYFFIAFRKSDANVE